MIGRWFKWDKNAKLRHQAPVYNEYERDIATIVKYELEITMAVSGGHKAADNDQFKEYREELIRLRAKWNIPNHVQQKYGGKISLQK